VIELVDVDTLKVVATFPSQSEADISLTNIRRGSCQRWLAARGILLAVRTVVKLLIILYYAENLTQVNQLLFTISLIQCLT
jgi:hypothetical protein